jgi:acyl transferase domain-containing protein
VTKQTAVVICPGRGTYNKPELGYFKKHHADKTHLLETIDHYRLKQGQPSIAELDAQPRYSMAKHTAGEHASALIYACTRGDFESISQADYDIVAITGNSMGWYTTLALSQALDADGSIELINTMGSMMTGGIVGGQLLYPVVDENWRYSTSQEETLAQAVAIVNAGSQRVYDSIYLGGYRVLGGTDDGLKDLAAALPTIDDTYPMRLHNHAAFHTPLLKEVSDKAFATLNKTLFGAPKIPIIDGRGHIWQPYSTNIDHLYAYTLGHQVTHAYDFSKAVEVALKEFAPDKLIIPGPGTTLGGAVAQCLIAHEWLGLTSKAEFIERQKQEPFLLSMGIEEQRSFVV